MAPPYPVPASPPGRAELTGIVSSVALRATKGDPDTACISPAPDRGGGPERRRPKGGGSSSLSGGGSRGGQVCSPKPQDPAYWRERHADLHPAQEEPYYDKILADMAAFRLSQDHWLPHSIWTHLPISPSSTWLPADP